MHKKIFKTLSFSWNPLNILLKNLHRETRTNFVLLHFRISEFCSFFLTVKRKNLSAKLLKWICCWSRNFNCETWKLNLKNMIQSKITFLVFNSLIKFDVFRGFTNYFQYDLLACLIEFICLHISFCGLWVGKMIYFLSIAMHSSPIFDIWLQFLLWR